jgi:lysophospholipase L1-like esterase
MRLHFKKWYLKAVILALMILTPMNGMASAQSCEKIDYVAMGDSLSVGYTPYGTIDNSYTDFIAMKLEGEGVLGSYQNFGEIRYTTADVLASIDYTNPQNSEIILAVSNAELITVDIGANDILDLIPVLMADPTQAPGVIQNVAENLAEIILTLKAINPNVKIYIMGYYNAFRYWPGELQQQVIPLVKGLNSAINQVADATGVTYVDTYTIMDKHSRQYLPEDDIHPGLLGYKAIEREFWSFIKVDFLRGRE